VRDYWNQCVHDAELTVNEPGTAEFFRHLEQYRFDKLAYLPQLVNFDGYADRDVLEIGCGIGTDLVRFAGGGARVSGVDVSMTAIGLARRNLRIAGVDGNVLTADGGQLPFPDSTFDFVHCHGVLPYAPDPAALIREAYRVLRPGGEALFMAYNRRSWLAAISRVTGVALAHADAPVFRVSTRAELMQLVDAFDNLKMVTERFPVATRLHGGWKARLYNHLFVPVVRLVPRSLLRPMGWHLLAFCRKPG